MKTTFFKDCFGVFQGGGPRAAAFAGAYAVTYDAGVRFSEVAGTSAGSIAAALIGAGASPAFLRQALMELDFTALLEPTENEGSFNGAWHKWVGAAGIVAGRFSSNAGLFGRVLYHGGLYSSRGLEAWIEQQLQKLLGLSRPVLFSDLPIPTYVVATDFSSQRERVWSRANSPNTRVAFAVRASSSIPFFFQAVVEGNARLVDGGILSNLPAFVFAKKHQDSGKPILAFRLQGTPAKPADWSLSELIKQLVDTSISGASEIQLGLQQGVSHIDISTGDIRATDFDRMDDDARKTLFKNGELAAIEFIASEAIHFHPAEKETPLFHDQDHLYLEIVAQSARAADSIILAESNTDWYWQLFPTVLHWRLSGIPVRVLLLPAAGDARTLARERTRRRNLAGLGVHIEEVSELPFRAYLFDRESRLDSAAIVCNWSGNVHDPNGVLYRGEVHQPVIRAIRARLIDAFKAIPSGIPYSPVLNRFDHESLCRMLKEGVAQYNKTDVSITIEAVRIEGVRTITKFVRTYKYEQMRRLIAKLVSHGMELFEPAAVVLADGKPSIVVPPVFELHGNQYIGVEGNTRAYYALREGRETIMAAVVRNVSDPLPGSSVDVSETSQVDGSMDSEDRMPDFNYSQFRRIEGACRPLDPAPPA